MVSPARSSKKKSKRVYRGKGNSYGSLSAWGLLLGPFVAGSVALFIVWSISSDKPPPASRLVRQMELAANGVAPASHVFGGALRVDAKNGGLVITADAVPHEPCVHAGWALVRKGRVAINGAMPRRVSAAILTELCGREEKGTTITWFPENSPFGEGPRTMGSIH
jgi:hypothetical protein